MLPSITLNVTQHKNYKLKTSHFCDFVGQASVL